MALPVRAFCFQAVSAKTAFLQKQPENIKGLLVPGQVFMPWESHHEQSPVLGLLTENRPQNPISYSPEDS
ncbi:hypothetical protein ACD591_16865 [Rufibacter glacialis]|uniref:Uncharacterized protein n=1 Tax=Rufibacter glacialis TaxID=1259555 RepID=A0A5M8QG99_9BACT|nr:hypothetical protein [Rufibacter glacialis]KAA6434258.1 hypothetical protein FOE74_08600 [Rufibacter glacialis]